MMRTAIIWVISAVALTSSAVAAEGPVDLDLETARLLGGVSEGRWTPPIPRQLPDLAVQSERVIQRSGGSITMRRVVPPVPVEPGPEVDEEEESSAEFDFSQNIEAPEYTQSPEFCFISATVYDGGLSLVEWWHKRNRYEAWSNVDWHSMGGFHQFFGRGESFLMLPIGVQSQTEAKQQLRDPDFRLPQLAGVEFDGPKYILVEGSVEDEMAMKFMDVLHDLYAAETPRLEAARVKREENREEREKWEKANPPGPKDTVFEFWRNVDSSTPENDSDE